MRFFSGFPIGRCIILGKSSNFLSTLGKSLHHSCLKFSHLAFLLILNILLVLLGIYRFGLTAIYTHIIYCTYRYISHAYVSVSPNWLVFMILQCNSTIQPLKNILTKFWPQKISMDTMHLFRICDTYMIILEQVVCGPGNCALKEYEVRWILH